MMDLTDAGLRELAGHRTEAMVFDTYRAIGADPDEAIVLDEDVRSTIHAGLILFAAAIRDAARAEQREADAREAWSYACTVRCLHDRCKHARDIAAAIRAQGGETR